MLEGKRVGGKEIMEIEKKFERLLTLLKSLIHLHFASYQSCIKKGLI